QTKNPTLKAVAALCAEPVGGTSAYSRNRRIRAIVNFNLDTIFTQFVRARYRAFFTRTVERASKKPRRGTINVYHMHGCLRFDPKWEARDEASDKLVFTEPEYLD